MQNEFLMLTDKFCKIKFHVSPHGIQNQNAELVELDLNFIRQSLFFLPLPTKGFICLSHDLHESVFNLRNSSMGQNHDQARQ